MTNQVVRNDGTSFLLVAKSQVLLVPLCFVASLSQ